MPDANLSNLLNDRTLRTLKEAIRNVFWGREELRKAFKRVDTPAFLLSEIHPDVKVWHSVDVIIDALNANAAYHAIIEKLIRETLLYRDGKHLNWAGAERVQAAHDSLKALRVEVGELAEGRIKADKERAEREERLKKAKHGQLFSIKLEELKQLFYSWHGESDVHARGFKFEHFLSDLFDLFDLAPKGSFRRNGEQIDGAFRLKGDNFLLEAKWQQAPVDLNDLRNLNAAIKSTLETTLGLFIAVGGFSPNSLENLTRGMRPSFICMDAGDLISVLEGRIALDDLLTRKKDVAAQKRIVLASAADFLAGKY